jgi:phenylalanyl-tRNA synthetase beta chain
LRVPLSWLREYVDFDLGPEELASLFSLRSQEVDGTSRYGVLEGEVVVGEVQEFGPHPNADRLSVAKVDIGGREVQIVAGAPNPYPGARVPVVLPGSVLADGTRLEKAKLRGLESYGMMMSERELGISPDHGGILLLDESYRVGNPISDYFPVGEEVLELDVNPNRPDLWGMIGVARELAAILGTGFRIPEPHFEATGEPSSAFGLRVEAPDLCHRYDLRRVTNLTPGLRAPLQMRRRIYAAGMRPIGAVVDATNYVMLETGQPIHAFDAARVRGGIVVRRAEPDERITLLDGSTRLLDSEMLVIADEERGLVIAGIMGAEDAEVDDTTTDALIEVANFEGRNILETSKRLGLRTDASGRFERGLDPNMVDFAMERVVGLLTDRPNGRTAPDTLSHYPSVASPRTIPVRLARAETILGIPVDGEEAARNLTALGCEVERDEQHLVVTVPTFRRDLTREIDLIEEVGRLVGLERVPEVIPGVPQAGGLTPEQQRRRLLRRVLSDAGLAEAVTYPFGPDRWLSELGFSEEDTVRLVNPLSAEARNLRRSLLPGLLDAAARNRAVGLRGGALFETGHVYQALPPTEDLLESALRFRMTGERDGVTEEVRLLGVEETDRVAGLLMASVRPVGWNVPEERADYYRAKGIVERIVPGAGFEREPFPFLHPGRSAAVTVGGRAVGWVGEVHPVTAESFELEGWALAAFELDLVACDPDPTPRFRPFPNVPAIVRDLAVVADSAVGAGELLYVARRAGSVILADARVFDVYEGEQLPEGKKSVALSLTLQGEETLTDGEADAEVGRIAGALQKALGARVRDS